MVSATYRVPVENATRKISSRDAYYAITRERPGGNGISEREGRISAVLLLACNCIQRRSSQIYKLNTMSDHATLPLEAYDKRSVFLEHAWNIGRAYRNQAMELISICQLLSQIAPPKLVHEDVGLKRMRRLCDLALRSAADSGTKVTDETNARFHEAIQILSNHSERRHRLDLLHTVHSKMERAKIKDDSERDWPRAKSDECSPAMTVNFVLLRSPILSPHDPETITVSQELSAGPSLPEILWNFSRYGGRARITLEQNPHFYLRCPVDESAYTPTFRRHPLQDTNGVLEHNDTDVWLLNGSLIFRDYSGVLEGEQLVRSSGIRGKLWYCEQPVVRHDSGCRPSSQLNHRCLRPIVTTPPAGRSVEGIFEDWTVLNRAASRCVDIHICDLRESTSSLDLPPPPPTSERPGYGALYVTVNWLKDDILLGIFDYYRLEEEKAWNVRLGWRKLSQVCQRWRDLVFSSAFHLGMHILCTNGTPIVDTLDHLPPLPLFVNYRYTNVTISEQDELGICHALRLRDRVRRIDLHLPPSPTLDKLIMLMDGSFPTLEHLSISFTVSNIIVVTLPKTFWAPNLRHLALRTTRLPKRLRLLCSTVSLVTLMLTNIVTSGYCLPGLLVARLQSLTQLETLSIGFSIPIPRPSAERELLSKQGTPVTLPNLKTLVFHGVSAYLEYLVARIRAPLLERLNITLFNQLTFALPHLSRFAIITEALKLHTAKVLFENDGVSITTDNRSRSRSEETFLLRVTCKQLDWQIDCAAQICSALMPALSGVEMLKLDFYGLRMPTEWQNGEIDGTTWHELLRSFTRVRELCICSSLSEELSRALEVDEIGSDPGLLPGLQELVSETGGVHTAGLFGSFIHARQIAGRPVRSWFPSPLLLPLRQLRLPAPQLRRPLPEQPILLQCQPPIWPLRPPPIPFPTLTPSPIPPSPHHPGLAPPPTFSLPRRS